MIQMAVFYVALIFGAHAGAADDQKEMNFADRWVASPMLTRQGPGGAYSAKILNRVVRMGSTTFTVGNIVYFKFPKPAGTQRFDQADFARKVGTAMGIEHWLTRRQGAAYVFESDWLKKSRWVRIFATMESDGIAISVSNYRLAFSDPVAVESEILQRELNNVLEVPAPPWLRRMMSAFESAAGIQTAFAEPSGAPQPCPTCTPGDFICMSQAAACQLGQLTPTLSKMGNDISSAKQLMTDISSQFKNTSAMVDKRWGESNSLLKSFLDPGHAFVWAAATAAGAAIGAMAVSLAADGIAAAGAGIYELITGEREEKILLARFREAREKYESLTSAASDLERAIDNLLKLDQLSAMFKMNREDMLAQLGTLIALTHAKGTQAEKELEMAISSSQPEPCILEKAKAKSELSSIEALLESIKTPLKLYATDKGICSQLTTLAQKLEMAESELQKTRGAILAGQSAWQHDWLDNDQQLEKDILTAKKNYQKMYERRIDFVKERYEKNTADQKLLALDWILKCENRERDLPDWLAVPDDSESEAKRKCTSMFYRMPQGIAVAKELSRLDQELKDQSALAKATLAKQIAAQDKIQADSRLADGGYNAYMKWFTDVGDQVTKLDVGPFSKLAARKKSIREVCGAPLAATP